MSRWSEDYGNARLRRKHLAPPGVHIMGKPEAKVMRKLQALTKMTEEEIRKVKKYRKMLSEAQNNNGKIESARNRWDYLLVKCVLEELGLPLEHPKTKQRIKEKIIDRVYSDFSNKLRSAEEYEIFYNQIRDKDKVERVIMRYQKYKKKF